MGGIEPGHRSQDEGAEIVQPEDAVLGQLVLPVPELVILLDGDEKIRSVGGRNPGTRLHALDFEPGRTIHEAIHPGCSHDDCQFLNVWKHAWPRHGDGLPVEWVSESTLDNAVLRFRLQSVDYACYTLYQGALEDFQACSVLFIQDISVMDDRRAELLRKKDEAVRQRRGGPRLGRSVPRRPMPPDLTAPAEVQDLERRRIARDLHDGLGQTLSLLHFEIEGMLEDARSQEPGPELERMERANEYLHGCLGDLRRITRHLRPAMLEDLGLGAALHQLGVEVGQVRPGLDVRVDISASETRVPDQLALSVFRIVQESLNNVARHAEASEVQVVFAMPGDGIELMIRDNGVGFDPGQAQEAGFGLGNMRQRVESSGGRFRLSSKSGRGATVRATWTPEMVSLLR